MWIMRAYWPLATFPYTHDGSNHLARFANYAAALREGGWPPRWAPYLFAGFGLPVFAYNYPLANIVATPLVWLGLNPEIIFRGEVILALGLGMCCGWQLLRQRFSRTASSLAIIFYGTSSFLLNLLFFRGNIGEIWMYGLIPVVIFLWRQALRRRQLVWWMMLFGGMIAWWLAHNVFTFLTLPFLLLLSGGWSWSAKQLRWWLVIWIGSLLATAWFWWPAMGELSLVVIAQDDLASQAWQHLLTWEQALCSPLRFGFSLPGPIDSLGYGLGLTSVMTFGLATVVVVRNIWEDGRSKNGRWQLSWLWPALLVVVAAGAVWLSTFSSSWLWHALTPLNIIQFPWRWLLIPSLILPWLLAWSWDRVSWWGKFLLLGPLLFTVLSVATLRPADRFHYDRLYYRNFPESTLTRNEDRPQTLSSGDLGSWSPGPRVATGSATVVKVAQWRGLRHQYTIQVNTEAMIIEPTVYFPGWLSQADGVPLAPVFTNDSRGLIAYRLPARTQPYQIDTKFSEQTPLRITSDVVSLVAILAFFLGAWYCKYRRKI
jgi:hypothetical protein